MEIKDLYFQYIKGRRASTDTRQLQKGDVFIALKGDNFNGNRFAQQALEAGAETVFIDDADFKTDERCVVVDDTLRFLQEIALFHRRELNLPIIGITGTNGKTTTKELCNAVLSAKFNTQATKGNLNNHIGVPLTLLNMDESTEIGIVEMGANHPHEIGELCRIAEPNYGIITNIGSAHLQGFGSFENIKSTKKELYDFVIGNDGVVFVNIDDPLLMSMSEGSKRITYGTKEALTKGEVKQTIPYLVFTLKTLKGDMYVKTQLTGGYNFSNAMAAAAVGNYFNLSTEEIRTAIEEYTPDNMRSQIIKTATNTIILDAYNANPSSMRVALDNFSGFQHENKAVILGEMFELGDESRRFHEEVAEMLNSMKLAKIFLIGKGFDFYKADNSSHFNSTAELNEYLKNNPIRSSYVFVKGSRGNKLEQVIEYL
ncbi:MAG: UDP-N-acetylmuramoyl-tripeptide--D-alanyl-D-alanine ligase [Culturomica sp.]|jgi:UDP-N-acetylmuramoyl-tripeptide--D-alanyl-D-alanine ligase|nr:UDP-N-acetylmuramoyl-tripeptide--D-alanyl-D-alanine ligase [Culturomica sp.]